MRMGASGHAATGLRNALRHNGAKWASLDSWDSFWRAVLEGDGESDLRRGKTAEERARDRVIASPT